MKQTLSIARLTFREGIRMRIVLVFVVVLGFIVLRLPFALRGDETLAGRLQTFLSYSLGALGVFMSLATVFFSCATLSQEIRTRTMHLVVTKPVARFQILLGKWLGVNALNLMICVLSAVVIYAFACFIRQQPELNERDRVVINEQVWTARLAASPTEPDFRAMAEEQVELRERDGEEFIGGREAAILELEKQAREAWRLLPPGDDRPYEFEGLAPPTDSADRFQIRFQVRAYPIRERVGMQWGIIDPESGDLLDQMVTEERPDEYHQFLVRPQGWVKGGRAVLAVRNPNAGPGAPTLHFEGDDALQIRYEVGNFEMNFVKAVLLILLRLSFLSALGVFFSAFVSFPVACFCVCVAFMFALAAPWWLEAVGMGMPVMNAQTDPFWGVFGAVFSRLFVWSGLGVAVAVAVRLGGLPLRQGLGALAGAAIALELLNLGVDFYNGDTVRIVLAAMMTYALPDFSRYDGGLELIDGLYIDWGLISTAALHTLVYGGLLLLLPGWLIFRGREIGEVTV